MVLTDAGNGTDLVEATLVDQSVDAFPNSPPDLVSCRLTLSTPPISRAKASRRASSSSSGFQFIHALRIDRLVIVVHGHRNRFARDTVVEDVAFSAFEQAAERTAELNHQRRDLGMQTLLVIHRGQKADGDDH